MTQQINAVENPIINSPYEEPRHHWHIEEGQKPRIEAGRRPASYFLRVPDRAGRGRRAADTDDMFAQDWTTVNWSQFPLANLAPTASYLQHTDAPAWSAYNGGLDSWGY